MMESISQIQLKLSYFKWGLLTFFLVCMTPGLAQRGDNTLTIPFGNNSRIEYNLKAGNYSIRFNSLAKIQDAYSLVKGKVDGNSQSFNYKSNTKKPFKNKYGSGLKYTVIRENETGIKMLQEFFVFKHRNYFLAQLKIIGRGAAENFLCPLHSENVSFDQTGDNRALFVPFDNDMWVRYNAERLDTAHFKSSEVSAIYNNNNYNGLVIGSIEHEVWKSAVQIKALTEHKFTLTAFAGYTDNKITHDQRAHGSVIIDDSVSASPKILVGYFDDWRKGMETFGRCNTIAEPHYIFDWKGDTPMGWNSWGVLQDKLTLDKVKGVIDFFHDSCKIFRTKGGTLFIDLDSYWDKMTKGEKGGNTEALEEFVKYCKEKGFQPGIYWAPFTDWGKQADRRVEGSTYTYAQCWTKVNGHVMDVDGGRAMDPTSPGTKQRIVYYTNLFKKLGFKMIKIDFLAHATLEADHYYDAHVQTGMEAFKEGMEFLNRQLDGKMLVYAAISPNLATARYVHMRRIACDAFKRIDETAYTLNSTTYGWWLGEMYNFLDADHVVFDDVSDGENRARLASAIVTGSLITGDDYSSNGKWSSTAQKLLQNKELLSIVMAGGKPFRSVEANTGQDAANIFTKVIGKHLYIAVFNYSDKLKELKLPLTRLGLDRDIGHENLQNIFPEDIGFLNHQQIVKMPPKDAAIFKFRIR